MVFEVEEGGRHGATGAGAARRWLGHRTSLADVEARDAVILLEGRLQIAFGYADRIARLDRTAGLDDARPARYVRLVLRDRATGAAPLPPPVFPIRRTRRRSCSKAEATPACIPPRSSRSAAPAVRPAGEQPR